MAQTHRQFIVQPLGHPRSVRLSGSRLLLLLLLSVPEVSPLLHALRWLLKV